MNYKLKFPKSSADFEQIIRDQASLHYTRGYTDGIEAAKKTQSFDITQAKITLIREAAAVASANAKLCYGLSQIVGEKKGFGAS